MTVPTEADFALVKMGDGADPEVFSTICGLTNVTVNTTAQSSDRYVRDCDKPNAPAKRKQRITGTALDVSGSGLSNVDMIPDLQAAIGALKNYKVELYADDGTDNGELLGTYAFASHMTAANLTSTQGGDSTAEITLPSHGDWTFTPAP